MTFEKIMERMLGNIPDNIDKREGSIIWNAISPVAFEMASMYAEMSHLLDLALVDTSVGEYLTRLSAQFQVHRLKATASQREINFVSSNEFEVDARIGDRFLYKDIVFALKSKIDTNKWLGECETLGEVGNSGLGEMETLQYITNLKSVSLGDTLIYGEDQEEDEELRSRLQIALAKNPTDGNIQQYIQWATAFSGVGRAKVHPLWAGGNTVKVYISSSKNDTASAELVSQLQAYLDPHSRGLGIGKAPIGAKVTVASGNAKQINVVAQIKLNPEYEDYNGVEEAIRDYLASITFLKNSVSYLKLGSTIMDVACVQDVVSLTINDTSDNIALAEYDIPVLNSLTIEVVA